MKNKFTTIIISLVIMGIFSVLIIFIMAFINEFINTETTSKAQNFVTELSDEETIENNIKTPQIINNPFDQIQAQGSQSTQNDSNYTNVKADKYFYNQLEANSKTIYKAFESNKENMKSGKYKIELGTSFTQVLKQENGQELLGEYYQAAIEAYTYDNPDVFYLSPNKMYLNIETTTKGSNITYNVYIDNGKDLNYLTDEFTSKEEINRAMQAIQNVKDDILNSKTGNNYDDIKMVHDYLIDKISYDSTVSKENIYNIYGALINNECVCEGYARSFKYLLDEMNIPCVIVIGKGTNSKGKTENHAWNYVKLDGTWYAIDTTWDDPVSTTGWVSQSSKYKYFLKGTNDINKDHAFSGQFTEGGKVFEYPTLSNSNY